jgi:hypothetical protein
MDFAKDNLRTVEIKNKLLLATNSEGNTAWHLAAQWGTLDALQKMCNLVKDNLTREEIENNFSNSEGNTAWQWQQRCEVNKTHCRKYGFAKDNLTMNEIKIID